MSEAEYFIVRAENAESAGAIAEKLGSLADEDEDFPQYTRVKPGKLPDFAKKAAKEDVLTTSDSPRRRGRPATAGGPAKPASNGTAASSSGAKRGRGRPPKIVKGFGGKKIVPGANASGSGDESDGAAPAKRGRGRPAAKAEDESDQDDTADQDDEEEQASD